MFRDQSRYKQEQEQEVNNAGFPLRLHITTVVCQVNVLQTRFIILQSTKGEGRGQPWLGGCVMKQICLYTE